MERSHSRDIRLAAPRAVTDKTASTLSTSISNSLWRRGGSMVRSVLAPRKDCVENDQVNTCEKPSMSTDSKIGLMAGIGVVALLAVVGILVMLHLRAQRNARAEFANDHHEASDYGLDDIPKQGGKGGHLKQPPSQANRRSAQQLVESQNPFGAGAEMVDGDKTPRGSPPKYPDAVKM